MHNLYCTGPCTDLNSDAAVNVSDLLLLLAAYGSSDAGERHHRRRRPPRAARVLRPASAIRCEG